MLRATFAIERQVVSEFVDQHMRQQRLGGHAAIDRPLGRGRLHDRLLAGPTAIPRPPDYLDPELGRNVVQHLCPVLADRVQGTAATGTRFVFDIDHRQGVTLDRSTLCSWVGRACWWLAPLHELILSTVMSSPKVVADDTTLPVLDPGRGRTMTGRLWCYATDNRPWAGPGHPAAAYLFSEDRKGEHPACHLKGFRGLLQVDGYAGFVAWSAPPETRRRNWRSAGRMPDANFTTSMSSPSRRLLMRPCGGSLLSMRSRTPFAVNQPNNASWCVSSVADRLSRPSMTGCAATRTRLRPLRTGRGNPLCSQSLEWADPVLDDGRLELDTNIVERAMRPVATPGSLCTSSSSVCKHWKLICDGDVTRAPFTPSRLHHGRCVQVGGTDLERRTANDLLGGKDTCLDQLTNPVAGDAASLGRFAQGQPGPVLLSGLVGVNVADTADRANPMGGPSLALASRQTHPVERGGDILVRPMACHLAHDRKGIVGGATPCSPVRGLRRRSSECRPPFQWMIRTISRAA